jgi:hypothetical protein
MKYAASWDKLAYDMYLFYICFASLIETA